MTMRIIILSLLLLLKQGLPCAEAFSLSQKSKPFKQSEISPPFQVSSKPSSTGKSPLFGSNPTYIDIHHINNRHSASDFLYNVLSLPQSVILREIRFPVLAVAGWSLIVSLVHRILLTSGPVSQTLAMKMSISGTAHSFLVSALGLLLVFRTNSAYQRFNEGRKIWENILSVSRNLSRMVYLYAPEIGKERVNRIIQATASFPYLLRHHIRPGCLCNDQPIDPEHRLLLSEKSVFAVDSRFEGDKLQQVPPSMPCYVDKRDMPWSLLPSTYLSQVAQASNRPLWVCDFLGRQIMKVPYGPNYTSRERLSFLGQIEKLTNAVGQCERIHQTSVPLNYARHSLRSLTLWLFTLPFALIKDMGLMTAPVVAAIAWVLFGVYQIGYTIEDPFQGSLRLSILCDSIRNDILGQQKEYGSRVDEEENITERINSLISHNAMNHLRNEEEYLAAIPSLIGENGTWTLVDAK